MVLILVKSISGIFKNTGEEVCENESKTTTNCSHTHLGFISISVLR